MSTTLFNVGKLDDLFTLENPVLQRLKRFSRKVDLCYKRFELFHFPSHSVSLHKTARAQTTGKYTLNKICIIIPREKLLFTKAAWSHLWRARSRLCNNARNKCELCGAVFRTKKKRQGKESTT